MCQVVIKTRHKNLIQKYGYREQNKAESILSTIITLPLAYYTHSLVVTPTSILLIIIGAGSIIAVTLYRAKMLETIPSHIVHGATIWIFAETFVIDSMLGVIDIKILVVLSVILKMVGIWWSMGGRSSRDKNVLSKIFFLSILGIIRLYAGNILMSEGYISKNSYMLICHLGIFVLISATNRKIKLNREIMVNNIPYVMMITVGNIINLMILEKGANISADITQLSVVVLILFERKLKLEKKQWIGVILLMSGWLIVLIT